MGCGKHGVILSAPAKLAVGFGREICPARSCHGRKGRGSLNVLHPKVPNGTDGGSSAPVGSLFGHETPTGFGDAAHGGTREGYVVMPT
jgi:hypothetical protein